MKPLITTFCLLVLLTKVQLPGADKSEYTLFNPTPDELMRDLSTDRPDQTESPYTVDAGHFQLEMDFFNFTYDQDNPEGIRSRAWSIAPFNFKVGLHNTADLQFVFEPFIYSKVESAGSRMRERGFGDLTIRLKQNLWGNDGGRTAFALMPYVKVPTAQHDLGNNAWEGGLIAPLAVELPRGWSLGIMPEIDFVEDEDDNNLHLEYLQTVTLSHGIIGNLAGFIEFASLLSAEPGSSWEATVNFGFTYAVNDNVQLDGGVNVGVTHGSDDFRPFAGISWRF